VFKIGEKSEEVIGDSSDFVKESLDKKEGNLMALSKVKAHLKNINQLLFGGQPDSSQGTSFQKFMTQDATEKLKKSSEWQVIGRVKIKPPTGEKKEGKEKVERIYLDQFSAHKVLRALPTLPSIC
jgi:hypothetical protein